MKNELGVLPHSIIDKFKIICDFSLHLFGIPNYINDGSNGFIGPYNLINWGLAKTIWDLSPRVIGIPLHINGSIDFKLKLKQIIIGFIDGP